ncbi:hypothetical protein ACLOJK_008648 [Asimina triloba]
MGWVGSVPVHYHSSALPLLGVGGFGDGGVTKIKGSRYLKPYDLWDVIGSVPKVVVIKNT